MLKIKKILYPTDFSGPSDQAFAAAVFLAERYGAELHMLHVLALHAADPNDPEHSLPGLDDVYEQLSGAADARMRTAGETHASTIEIHQSQSRGLSAAAGVLDYAQDQDVDLIVMGTHGRRGLRRFIMGSVAEEVVRLARCPVLTTRGEDGKKAPERFDRILVPIDFTTHSRVALDNAKRLAADYGAHVTLLHVVEEVVYPDFYYPVSAMKTIQAESLREEAKRRLDKMLDELGPGATAHVSIGRAWHEIAEFAAEDGTDLIVIATHGLTGIESAILGSVAGRVTRMAPCSVLSIRSFGKSLLAEPDESEAEAVTVS
jgi:nucleotide-binding universal stress UspA family protein